MASATDVSAPVKPKKTKKWIWIGAAAGVIVLLLLLRPHQAANTSNSAYQTQAVEVRSITNALSGSGTLLPANSYTVTTLVTGDVLEAGFEEGDVVEKDTVLYRIDSSDAESNIERAEIALHQAQRNYTNTAERQYIPASVSGIVQLIAVKEGDSIVPGQTIAVIRDNSVMTLKVPFAASDAASFFPGQAADITLDSTFETLSGTVQSVSSDSVAGPGNMPLRYVTVTVTSPGTLTDTQAATVSIGGRDCAANATFSYRAAATVTAESAGTVVSVEASEGAWVSNGQTLVTLGSNDLDDMVQSAAENVRSAELSLSATQKDLDNYTITSPIKGTIVEKKYKQGDTIEERGRMLCMIYDLEYLEMTLNVDELDIRSVAVGQHVTVTAEAVDGKVYDGVVTRVSVAGSTVNATTSYPVTVRIDETDGLLPGMNVDAEIVMSEAENVLSVPNEAVLRGNVVLITADSPSAANALDREAPSGYVYVNVVPGISSDDYTEIQSGLQDGDTVAYIPTSSGLNPWMQMMTGGRGDADGGAPR
ncbi:MAG: HlyD family efflux transporter periplasmic adaptor subunit [Oscillospiraceae bacterium]|nr:HlyD family efflux transporter periplasmic adaptor subunit [Oscillospiraceae bacterium]